MMGLFKGFFLGQYVTQLHVLKQIVRREIIILYAITLSGADITFCRYRTLFNIRKAHLVIQSFKLRKATQLDLCTQLPTPQHPTDIASQ